MRIHTVAVFYVLIFSFFYHLTGTQYAILFVTFASVIAAEMFNTAAERLCDMNAPSFNPWVRIIKDVAAGAVLVCAIFAVAVGICLFWNPAVFAQIFGFFAMNPFLFMLLLISFACAWVYAFYGPVRIRDACRRKRKKKKSHTVTIQKKVL